MLGARICLNQQSLHLLSLYSVACKTRTFALPQVTRIQGGKTTVLAQCPPSASGPSLVAQQVSTVLKAGEVSLPTLSACRQGI